LKPRDREGFQAIIKTARAEGLTLTDAIARAYAWLLRSSKDVWKR
jgi:hypothetical protein